MTARAARLAAFLLAALGALGVGEAAAQMIAPKVNGLTVTAPPSGGDTFYAGDTITATFSFDRWVGTNTSCYNTQGHLNPGSLLRVKVQIGSVDRYANCSGDPRQVFSISFSYRVQRGDSDSNGLSIQDGAITGGQLTRGSRNTRDASVDRTIPSNLEIVNDRRYKVDGGRWASALAGVDGVTLNSPVLGDTFEAGETIEATVTFSRAVDVTGTPQLALTVGTQTRQASYASGTGTRTLVFRYALVAADADADGISVAANALTLNGGTIDIAGQTTDALLGLGIFAITNSSGHKVAGSQITAAAVGGVSITSRPDVGDAYDRNEQIEVTVTFNRAVDVTGTPQLALTVGTETRQAAYASGTGTRSLVFRYAVANDRDLDGVSIAAGALALNGGTINDARSSTTAASLGLGTHAIANAPGHKVDPPPWVSALSVLSPALNSTFERGEEIEVRVTFDEPVAVTGTPQVALSIGTATRQADYARSRSATLLSFSYKVVMGDADSDGLSIAADALGLNGGTIRAADGSADARRDFGAFAITDSSGLKVDGSTFNAASLGSLTVTSRPASGDTYGLGEWIELSASFAQPVAVTGTPQVALSVGTETRQADYDRTAVDLAGASSLLFRYLVQASDADADGIEVPMNGLALNEGSINDGRDADVPAVLTLNALAALPGHKVDGGLEAAPAVSRVALESAPAAGGEYGLGSEIAVVVEFDRPVEVTGQPTLALLIGSSLRRAAYASGTGTFALRFTYAVRGGDWDRDGLGVPADALSLNGGRIAIAGGAAAAELGLGVHALENVAGHLVHGGPEDARPPLNQPPVAVGSFGNAALGLGERLAVPLSGRFQDPEGGRLSHSAESSNAAVATARAVGGAVVVEGLSRGVATVTVWAFDPDGSGALRTFRVLVGRVLTFDAPVFSAPEGGTLRLGLSLGRPAEAALSVPWAARPDGDAATADADADDLGVLGGTVTFAAGATEAVVEIPVADDADIEPASESLLASLGALPEGADWTVGLGEARLEVQEGVCDRSPAVRDALRGLRECWVPSSADLAARRHLALNRRGVSSLRPKDFLELSGLRALHLEGNRLPSLPEGLFAGMAELSDLNLADNPGAPFPLAARLVRTDAEPWAPGPARVEARVAEGAPFAMSAEVRAEGAELSGASLSIPAGGLASGPLLATPAGAGAARLSLTVTSSVPAGRCGDLADGFRPCFQGVELQAGPPLVLFKPAPTPAGRTPRPTLPADGSRASFALDALIPPVEAGDRLSYRAESNRPDLAVARIADGLLALEANEDGAEGMALITLTATDPDGRTVSLSFVVNVEAAPRSGLNGWRLEWLRTLREDGQ